MAASNTMLRSLMGAELQMQCGLALRVSASIGVASAPADGTTIHSIIGAADSRMFDVKSSGRGHVPGA